MIYKKIQNCRVAGGDTSELRKLGDFYLSYFYDSITPEDPKALLSISIGEDSKLLQITHSVERDEMYRTYWYRSGTNETMTMQLNDIVNCIGNWVKLDENDIVLDIGCNDGTLLKQFNEN